MTDKTPTEDAMEVPAMTTPSAADYFDAVKRAERAEERVRVLENLLRRYHKRVRAADDLLAGIIASRSYLNEAMLQLPDPTIGADVKAALAKAAADPHPFDYDSEEANDAR